MFITFKIGWCQIHSIYKNILSVYYVLGTVLGLEETAVKKTFKIPIFVLIYIPGR